MINSIKRWLLRARLRLLTREMHRSREELDAAVFNIDLSTEHALKNWLSHLAVEKHDLVARLRELSPTTERKTP